MASVNTPHPDMTAERMADWALMRATMNGARAVKVAAETYLPMPGGFKSMPDGGHAAYQQSYKLRAIVPEIVSPSIGAMVGIIHAKEAQIAIPVALNGLWENADGDGGSLEDFHRKITRHLLWLGRYGVLTSAPATGGEPFLVGYSGDAIINWDRDFYVLDETGYQRAGFEWEKVPRFRVLTLEHCRFVSKVYEGKELLSFTASQPEALGGQPLSFVPFAVGNARNISPDVEAPPLIGVGNAVVAYYQLSADWRWQLYMSGQETLVAINGDAPTHVGAGAAHSMKGAPQLAPDLKYVSPSCAGIDAHLEAMREQKDAAVQAGARMFEETGNSQESGEARRLRFASETANLMSVAQVSAQLLERGLRNAARMKGLNDAAVAEIVVTPPKDLLDSTMTAQDLAALFGVYSAGGMSWQTYYERGQAGGMMSSERDADEEFALIEGVDGSETETV